jgi:hypothetical protein
MAGLFFGFVDELIVRGRSTSGPAIGSRLIFTDT